MKIAINNSPLTGAHKKRGIGYYTNHLIDSLREDQAIEIIEFAKLSDIPKVDVIHYPWFDLFFHSLPIRRKHPTIVTIHDVIPLLFPQQYPVGPRGKLNFVLQKIALKSCKYIITDSQASKKDIINYLNIENDKVVVIPLAADPNFKVLTNDARLLHLRRQLHLPNRFLLYVGDANWVKNLPFLIEGFREIISRPDFADVKLVLVGGVFLKNVEDIIHPELASLKLVGELIKKHKLETYVVRLGQLNDADLVSIYNLATVYVQPSLYEGFGLPILEAQACGIPVVSSNKGSLPEVGGSAAVYFDPTDINQFIAITGEVLGNISLQQKLSKLGLKQAEKFSWKQVANETKSVYFKAGQKNE